MKASFIGHGFCFQYKVCYTYIQIYFLSNVYMERGGWGVIKKLAYFNLEVSFEKGVLMETLRSLDSDQELARR